MLAALVSAAAGLLGACGSTTTTTTGTTTGGNPCVGGVIVNGVCEGKCKPELCKAGNTCVNNQCELQCTSHRDCFQDGTQDCLPAVEDDTKAAIFTCQGNGRSPGFGIGCPFGNECESFSACPDSKQCDPTQCGGKPDDCKADPKACAGIMDCSVGLCGDGTTACIVPSCASADCKPVFACHSTGMGDADAYCTKADCKEDKDCPGGYFCGVQHDPHEICGSSPKKGNNNFCGKTAEPCIDKATFGMGNTFQEGSECILRNVCLKRTACAPCASDLDCSLIDDEHCIDVGGEKHCALGCKTDKDCIDGYKCDPTAKGCIPKFGKCKGTGQFCEPCQSDLDCGASAICTETSSLSHETACFPLTTTKCTTSADCPKSPSGKNGYCLDDALGVSAGSPQYHTCYFPVKFSGGQPDAVTCW